MNKRILLTNKDEVLNWLQNNSFDEKQTYEITNDLTVKVSGNFLLSATLEYLPVNFECVSGDFDCSLSALTTLEGCPQVVGKYFHCKMNRLTSLKFGPQIVGGNYNCSGNQLESLEHCPKIINGSFYISRNPLTNLSCGPDLVVRDYDCSQTQISSISTLFTTIQGNFVCHIDKNTPKIKEIEHLYNRNGNCKIPFNAKIIQPIVEKNILGLHIGEKNQPNKSVSKI